LSLAVVIKMKAVYQSDRLDATMRQASEGQISCSGMDKKPNIAREVRHLLDGQGMNEPGKNNSVGVPLTVS